MTEGGSQALFAGPLVTDILAVVIAVSEVAARFGMYTAVLKSYRLRLLLVAISSIDTAECHCFE